MAKYNKYSYEFKLKVVQEYLSGEGGYKFLSLKHGIPSTKDLRKWVATYQEFGADGLMRSRKNKTYSLNFKLSVVELYLTTEVSYQELALQIGVNNPSLIVEWVSHYRAAGPDALKPKRKGRKSKLPKPCEISKDNSINLENECLKQLQEENLKLRIENAYLKELRRLRLEEIALNKKRELSITSEENLN